jgi:hypothetical protein
LVAGRPEVLLALQLAARLVAEPLAGCLAAGRTLVFLAIRGRVLSLIYIVRRLIVRRIRLAWITGWGC